MIYQLHFHNEFLTSSIINNLFHSIGNMNDEGIFVGVFSPLISFLSMGHLGLQGAVCGFSTGVSGGGGGV